MEDSKRLNRRSRAKRAKGNDRDESPADLIASYTPEQREAYLRGLRILAKFAVRAHMRRNAAEFETAQDGGGEEEGDEG